MFQMMPNGLISDYTVDVYTTPEKVGQRYLLMQFQISLLCTVETI